MDKNPVTILSEQENVQEADVRIEVLRGISVLPGGIANLILQLTRTMRCANASIEDIAIVQKSICEQFGVHIPDCFMASVSKEQDLTNNMNLLEKIIYDIYHSPGEKKWLRAEEMKQKYPDLKNYPINSIGKAAKAIGIPSKCSKGYTSYLLPTGI